MILADAEFPRHVIKKLFVDLSNFNNFFYHAKKWTYAWPPFLIWAIFGFIAVGYSWKFAFDSDFVIDQEKQPGIP